MRFDIFKSYDTLKHIVTEKSSNHPYQFSMALHTGEDEKSIIANRNKLRDEFGDDYSCCSVLQVHGKYIHVAKKLENGGSRDIAKLIEADAVITNIPKMVLTILTADCVPVLLFDPVSACVGAVHAGWRGTQEKIVSLTIERMGELYGSNPSDVIAGIGPAIGGCCYEVGIDVAKNFTDYTDSVTKLTQDKFKLDLKAINRTQLLEAGLHPEHIELSSICTSCSSDRFFSYRAQQGCSGRFMSAIALV
jgi:YfiH family protein